MYLKRIHSALDLIKLVLRLLELQASEVDLWFWFPTVVLEGLLLIAQLADSLIGQGVGTEDKKLVEVEFFFIATTFAHRENLKITVVDLPSAIQDKVRNVGFDWEDRQDVWKKVREELGELEVELNKEDKERSTEELGDFLFSVINAARLYKLNPDNALEKTNRKFINRFNYIEAHSIKMGKPLKDMTLGEMDALWEEAKRNER